MKGYAKIRMRKDKQFKKTYIAPKCEVYQIETCNLMDISAGVVGFGNGGSLDKGSGVKERAAFPNDFDFGTDNTRTETEEQL